MWRDGDSDVVWIDQDRRATLKGLFVGGLALTMVVPIGADTVRASSPTSEKRAIYVWGYAPVLARNVETRKRLFQRADRFGIQTVYLSWGALREVSREDRRHLVETMHAAGLDVHALTGTYGTEGIDDARGVVIDVVDYNADIEPAGQLDGIHLNVEFAPEGLASSLESYEQFLDELPDLGENETVGSQGLTTSATVAWWWAVDEHAPALARAIASHHSLDYSVIMAYWDTPEEVRRRLATVVSDLDAPYVLAIETQEFPGTTANERVTTYEEGWSRVEEIESAIAVDPPDGKFLGVALHPYMTGVAAWDALWEARLRTTTARPGDRVTVDTSVVFDDTFPTSSHESDLTVTFDGPTRYTTKRTVTPPASTLIERTIEWRVPQNARAGEYAVAVSLVDTTFEDDSREKAATRSDPVVLGERDLGTLLVEERRRGNPNRI
jgi:hypothetical protein